MIYCLSLYPKARKIQLMDACFEKMVTLSGIYPARIQKCLCSGVIINAVSLSFLLIDQSLLHRRKEKHLFY